MPTTIRQSGPKFQRDGETITPKALLHFCEECGSAHAPFLIWDGKTVRSFCGYVNRTPVCVALDPGAAHTT